MVNVLTRRKEFKSLKKGLDERMNVVTTGLENCGPSVKQLDTEAIIQVYYQAYNPQLARTQKVNHPEEYMTSGNPEDNLVMEK